MRTDADQEKLSNEPVPVEHAATELRAVTADRAPFGKARWDAVSDHWQRMDYDAAEFALRNGRVVAVGCAPEDRPALEMALLYECGFRIATIYRNGLLWVRRLRADRVGRLED